MTHDAPAATHQIPRVAHFVYGFREQREPFHLLHYIALESCRRVLRPARIYLHHQQLPFGSYWDRIRPHLTLVRARPAAEVLAADYGAGRVPEQYRYAHHADVVRLDALIEHGGVYADIDTVFLRPMPDELFAHPFVLGDEGAFPDEITGEWRPSLCNALMLSRPGAPFARAWRARLAGALNGTWSNHAGFLAGRLRDEMPDAVHVEPAASFYPERCTADGVPRLLAGQDVDLTRSYSAHLWAHVWWDAARRDFSTLHAGSFTPDYIRGVDTPLNRALRPYVPDVETW